LNWSTYELKKRSLAIENFFFMRKYQNPFFPLKAKSSVNRGFHFGFIRTHRRDHFVYFRKMSCNQGEERLGKIEKKEKLPKKNPPRIRKGDNEAERDTILKKRVECFC